MLPISSLDKRNTVNVACTAKFQAWKGLLPGKFPCTQDSDHYLYRKIIAAAGQPIQFSRAVPKVVLVVFKKHPGPQMIPLKKEMWS